MPEGDSVAKNAMELRPVLVGSLIDDVYATKGPVRANAGRLRGSEVLAVRTKGKNLIIDFSGGYSLLVHLGMTGRWRIIDSSRSVAGSATFALTVAGKHAVCSGAPVARVDRTPAIERDLERIGPDLLGDDLDLEDIALRAGSDPARSLSEVLLDQSIASGIGNVYKSELAFLARIHPDTPVGEIPREDLSSIYERASALLAINVRRGPRVTTGDRRRGRELWVYGRGGLSCRRCGTRIESEMSGDRVTYWCPTCQVAPDKGSDGTRVFR
jgi:endonuclease-8